MCPFGTICLVTLLTASIVECMKIHEQMTAEEIANFFHTSPDEIPEYEVVSVRHNLYKRSNSHLQLEFNAFGKKINAYLEPSDGVLAGENTPVWLASTTPSGSVEYKRMPKNIVGIAVESFISPSDLSSIVVIRADGEDVSFRGTIGDLTVKPLPKHFRTADRSERETRSTKTRRTLLGTHHHVIIKSTSSTNENENLKHLERQIRETRVFNETNRSKSKRSSKDIVYPSILIATDFAQSDKTQNDSTPYDDIVYQLAFWNAVDLRFRRVDDPKIRLRIAGIIIGLDRRATPYVNKYRKGKWVNIPQDYPAMDKYWTAMATFSDFSVEAYHIVATMTDNNMMYTIGDGARSEVRGLAFKGRLCDRSHGQFFVTTIINDEGGFDGVIPAAHELGHILGLGHDRKSGDECDESHYYIMSSGRLPAPTNLEWSPCSLRSLSNYLRHTEIKCLDEPAEFNPPGTSVRRLLPGDIADTHKQCQGHGYAWACETSPEICLHMKCYYQGWSAFFEGWWCKDAGPAVEGTACSPGHKCVDGVCQCMTEECVFSKT